MDIYPKSHLKTALLMAIILVVVLVALPARESPIDTGSLVSLSINAAAVIPLTEPSAIEAQAQSQPALIEPRQHAWRKVKIRKGDSLSTVFHKAGLSPRDLYQVMHADKSVAVLKSIAPGKTIDMDIDANGDLQALRYRAGTLRDLVIVRHGQTYDADWRVITPAVLVTSASGAITSAQPSLYLAAKKAGLPDGIIIQLANIFQWDISFALDLRKGDSFALVYQEKYVDGEKAGNGTILAAEFTNMGKTHKAVVFQDAAGHKAYYAPDGASMRKAFLRDPVHFSYISSSFNLHRMHPIFHRTLPHRGVDFAAPKGTPVMASGDGRITIARRNAASGRYIVIRHGREYTTKYLHLSRFAKGIRPGVQVKQGQVIGYVGQSGWATGPHLHYEFLVNGVYRNPRTIPLPKAAPVPATEMSKFKKETQPLLAKLDLIETGYASAAQTTLPTDVK